MQFHNGITVLGLLSFASTASWAQSPAADTSVGLEEIVITAEKREESLQKTALAVTALGGDELLEAGVSQPEDLNKLVPGLGIAQGGSSTQVYVRGVGNYGTNALSDPAVAFNMDGIYLARFSGITGSFYDLERVEVLKGPQGTLYGRNATGGAINIITKKPVNHFEAGATAEAGNYDLRKFDGYINLPAGDAFAVRLAAQKTDRDGYFTDGYGDEDSGSARLHLQYKPSDDFSLLVTGNYSSIGGKGPVQIPVSTSGYVDNNNPWLGLSEAAPIALRSTEAGLPPGVADVLGVSTLRRDDGKLDVKIKSVTAQMDANVGIGTLTLLGNYMDTRNNSKSYGPAFLFWQHDSAIQDSLEARLSGDSGPLKWVAGLYYFKEHQRSQYWVDQGFVFNQTGVDLDKLDDQTLAAFSQVTYSITDRLRLTGGLRYTDETKEQNGVIFNRQGTAPGTLCSDLYGTAPIFIGTVASAIPQAATNGDGVAYPFPYCADSMTGKLKWTDWSWKGGVDFDLAENSMVYASVSKGFKAGGFFSAGDHTAVGNRFDPEKLIAYAIGSKNRFANNRVQLNGEAFFWNYKNHQENYLAPLFNGNVASFGFITQSADAHIYGLDLELTTLLTDDDNLGVKLQYLHAEYTDAAFRVARPGEFTSGAQTSPPSTACSARFQSTGLYITDCSGQQMPRSPDWSGTLDYSHVFHIGNAGTLTPSANVQYSASYWSAVDYNVLQKQKSYALYGADLTYDSPNKMWSVTAYGRNLTDKAIYTNAFMYPATNISMNSINAPRTWGLRVSAKFE